MYPPRINEMYRSGHRLYLDLNGDWELRFDPDGISGPQDRAREDRLEFPFRCVVPGCYEAQDLGMSHEPIRKDVPPNWARNLVDIPYGGKSRVRRRFTVPAGFGGRNVFLSFGGVSQKCRVRLNGVELGGSDLAAVSFGFEVSRILDYRGENVVIVEIESRLFDPYHPDRNATYAYGLGVLTAYVNWQGIWRGVELLGVSEQWIRDVFFWVSAETGHVVCEVDVGGAPADDALRLCITDPDAPDAELSGCPVPAPGRHRLEIDGARFGKWDTAHPKLHRLQAALTAGGRVVDSVVESLGYRTVSFARGQILLNGEPVYLRGDLHHMHWPLTISTPVDREVLAASLKKYRELGFNFIRCHTHVPSPEFLDACDRLGLLVQVEPGVISYTYRVPEADARELWTAALLQSRNHPSVVVWCLGNEAERVSAEDRRLRRECVAEARRLDRSRVLVSNSPGRVIRVDGEPEGEAPWPVVHEFGKWGSYVDAGTRGNYRGAIRPWFIDYALERLREAGLADHAELFARNTKALMGRCIELAFEQLRSTEKWEAPYSSGVTMRGFEHVCVRDCAQFMWGILDDSFGAKWEREDDWADFNGETVLLMDAPRWDQRCFRSDREMRFTIGISPYGEVPEGKLYLELALRAGDRIVHKTRSEEIRYVRGEKAQLGSFAFPPAGAGVSGKLRLEACVRAGGGGSGRDGQIAASRSWDVWVFPATESLEPPVVLDRTVDPALRRVVESRGSAAEGGQGRKGEGTVFVTADLERAMERRRKGTSCLVQLPPPDAGAASGAPGWQCGWVAGRSENRYHGTIIASHPVLEGFPQEGWCDLPFVHLIDGWRDGPSELFEYSWTIGKSEVGPGWVADCAHFERYGEVVPIVLGIPSAKDPEPRRMAHLLELRPPPGKSGAACGRLLVTTFRFLENDPAGMVLLGRCLDYLGAGGGSAPEG